MKDKFNIDLNYENEQVIPRMEDVHFGINIREQIYNELDSKGEIKVKPNNPITTKRFEMLNEMERDNIVVNVGEENGRVTFVYKSEYEKHGRKNWGFWKLLFEWFKGLFRST